MPIGGRYGQVADLGEGVVAVAEDGERGGDIPVLSRHQDEYLVGRLGVEVVQVLDLVGEDAVIGEDELRLIGKRQWLGGPFGVGLEYGGDLLVQGTVVGAEGEKGLLLVGHVGGPGGEGGRDKRKPDRLSAGRVLLAVVAVLSRYSGGSSGVGSAGLCTKVR